VIIDNHTHTLIRMALEEDLGDRGDLTSLATLPPNSTITGRITAKAIGVIAGLAIVDAVYEVIDPTVKVTHAVKDGQAVEAGTLIAEVAGSSHAVLAGERIALNFLQRLSGVATLTAQFVQAVSETHTMILDTRKTTPGYRMLEKYAVKMGGGQNHRIGLHDMILIKDNHIDAAGGVTPAIQAALAYEIKAPIVVEVKNESELREALAFPITRILLDNMTTDQMRQAVAITAGRVPLEASGNMTLTRVKEVAHTGVNYISVGALTHSAPALDLSMRLSPIQR
jgi:nicotinate-nucleotide pyrophosphorylase (carboxylating)